MVSEIVKTTRYLESASILVISGEAVELSFLVHEKSGDTSSMLQTLVSL